MAEPNLKEPIQRAGRAAGSIVKLAERLDITPQAIYQWDRVPANRVLEVERAVGRKVTRHEMRPDIFGEAPKMRRRS